MNEERAHQGIDGRAPAEFSEDVPEVAVLRADESRVRRLVRREYASGILRGYPLVYKYSRQPLCSLPRVEIEEPTEVRAAANGSSAIVALRRTRRRDQLPTHVEDPVEAHRQGSVKREDVREHPVERAMDVARDAKKHEGLCSEWDGGKLARISTTGASLVHW